MSGDGPGKNGDMSGGLRAYCWEKAWKSSLDKISESGLRRELPGEGYFPGGTGPGAPLVLCSNDYLALSRDPRLKAAAAEALEACGCGSTGSRLLSGNSAYHTALESALAAFTGHEACLLFGSGYHANIGAIPALSAGVGAILSDELNHASIIDGCRLSRARTVTYRHCDPSHLEELLAEIGSRGKAGARPAAMVVTEGVFSMDGDIAPLADLAEVARERGAILMLDDAHGFGVLGPAGRGTPEAAGVVEGVDVYLGTLGKALGCAGGFVAGSRAMTDYLMSTARSFIYSTAPPPAVCAAAGAALEIVRSEPDRRRTLQVLSGRLRGELARGGLDTGAGGSHIVPVMTPGADAATRVAGALERKGYLTRAIRYPTVARGSERIRLSLRSDFTEDQMTGLAAALGEEGSALGITKGG